MIDAILTLLLDYKDRYATRVAARSAEKERRRKEKRFNDWLKKQEFTDNLYKVDDKWDKVVDILVDHGELTYQGPLTATFKIKNDAYNVWIGNHWYSFGQPYGEKSGYGRYLPSAKTKYKLALRLGLVQEYEDK